MQIMIAIDSFPYAEIYARERARTGHTQSRKILGQSLSALRTTTATVYDIRHAKLMPSTWRFNRAMRMYMRLYP